LVERFCEAARSDRADPRYGAPLFGLGCEDCPYRAESLKEGTGGLKGDAWNRREHRFGSLSGRTSRRSVRIHRPTASTVSLPSMGESVEPFGGVPQISGANEADLLIHDREQGAADCLRRHWSIVEIRTFYEQIRTRIASDQPDLRPQSTLDEREMEISYGLALDDRPGSKKVVTRAKVLSGHRGSKVLEQRRWTRSLMHVDNHPNPLRVHSPSSLRIKFIPDCANSFREAKRT
jgi:hypothetical protein